MKYVDFIVQTIILIGGIAMMVTSGLIDGAIVSPVFFIQLLIGCWQYLSSLISMAVPGTALKQKRRHFLMSTLYLLFLAFAAKSNVTPGMFVSSFVIFYVPWALAIYYYLISFKLVFNRFRKSSFLPHVNF